MIKNALKFSALITAVLIFNFGISAFANQPTQVPNPTFEFDPNYVLENPDAIATISEEIADGNIEESTTPLILEKCRGHTGFINKIVNCVLSMTTRSEVLDKIGRLNMKFAGAANAVVIMYVMLFGIRLSMNVIENVRGEIFVVLLTVFFVTYSNNAFRVNSFINFFVGFQNEFANVASIALDEKTYQHDALFEEVCDGPGDGCDLDPESGLYIRYLVEKNCVTEDPGRPLSIWRRMDCILASVLGVQPLIEMKGQYFDPQVGEGQPYDVGSLTSPTNMNNPHFFSEINSIGATFPDMSTDPFCFYKYTFRLGDVQSAIDTASSSLTDECFKKFQNMSVDDILKMARPVKTDRYESNIIFSFVIILIGTLFNDPGMGLIIFFSGFFVAILILAAFAQATFVYITSLFAIMVLGLFAPLILPCVLFKQTQGIFNKWVQLLFAYSLQPGILLCYLSFMIYILQFALNYKQIGYRDNVTTTTSVWPFDPLATSITSCNPGDAYCWQDPNSGQWITASYSTTGAAPCLSKSPTSETYRFHPECKGAVPSFKEFVGLLFQNSQVSPKEVLQMRTKTTTQVNQGSFSQGVMQGLGTVYDSSELSEDSWSLMGRGDEVFSVQATEAVIDNNDELLQSGFQINNRGSNVKSISIPAFSFAGGFNSIMKNFARYDSTNSNLETSLSSAQQNKVPVTDINQPAPLDTTAAERKQIEKTNFKLTMGFMQILLVLFVSLAITMTFMGNVMDFAGKLVGSSAIAVTPVNLYNSAASKMGRFLKS